VHSKNIDGEMRFYDEAYPPEQQLFAEAFSCWRRTLKDFEIDPRDIFQVIELVDSARAGQGSELTLWLPCTDLVRTRHLLQRGLDAGHLDRTLAGLKRTKAKKGEEITAQYLAHAKDDAELIAAILLEASLFARIGSVRSSYPTDTWPNITRLITARESILHLIRSRLPDFESWPQMCTSVLPFKNEDWWYRIEETYSLWRFLAEEHARLYSQFRVVVIKFVV
jgi:hypothetical protein